MRLTKNSHHSQPKAAQPVKATAAPKNNNNTNNAGGRGGRRRGRGGRPNRPKPKTAEELDQEMTDYFTQAGTSGIEGAAAPAEANGQAPVQQNQAAPAAGAAPATAGEVDDMGMDDIVSL